MFERFTDRARRVVVLAQEEARRLEHDCIGVDHLFLGLTRERDMLATDILMKRLGLLLDVLRSLVEEQLGQGTRSPSGHIPFTPTAKQVLETSQRESLLLGHNYIGPEHLLLAIARHDGSISATVLNEAGATYAVLREELLTELESHGMRPTSQDKMVSADVAFLALSWITQHEASFGPFASDHPLKELQAALKGER